MGSCDHNDEMVTAETAEGLDGSLGILSSFGTDEGKVAESIGELVLGEENTRFIRSDQNPEHTLEVSLHGLCFPHRLLTYKVG